MATGDGKYITLVEFKLYALGAIANPLNPTVYNGSVATTPDEEILAQSIQRAEMEVDRICGVGFDEQELESVQAFLPFIDGNGWLHMFARENVPVTEVTEVQLRDLAGNNTWMTLTFENDNVVLPPNTGLPRPDSAHVYLIPSVALSPRGTGKIMVKWSYTGGFEAIPDSLKNMVERLAWYIYKLREAPMYQVMIPAMGIIQMPIKIPPDILSDLYLWQPSYS